MTSGEVFKFRDGVTFKVVNHRGRETTPALIIFQGKRPVGFVKMNFDKATNTYYFFELKINERFRSGENTYVRGQGYGANLVEGINSFLRSKKAKGFLFNGVNEKQKKKMYERHGWKQYQDTLRFEFDGTKSYNNCMVETSPQKRVVKMNFLDKANIYDFQVFEGKKSVGTAWLIPRENGDFYLESFNPDPKKESQGIGRELILEINIFILERGVVCYTTNGIKDEKKRHFYEKYGWRYVDESKRMQKDAEMYFDGTQKKAIESI